MDEPASPKTELKQQTRDIKRSAQAVEQSAGELTDSADRRTVLAGDRTLLAAERTYAAWVRTALAALAAGIGARALVKDVLPDWVGKVTGSVLVIFAGFCLVAAIWRELQGVERAHSVDFTPIPRAILLPLNTFLVIVAIAALIGIWAS